MTEHRLLLFPDFQGKSVSLMVVRRDWLAVTLVVITATLRTTSALMTIIIMAIITIWTSLIMGLRLRSWLIMARVAVITLWRFSVPAIPMPVHAMLITFTVMMPLVIMPPLRWSPVIAIPVVSALILIPKVKRHARDIEVNRNICLCDHRQSQCTTQQ
mgnify:CR=1 FL=1